MASRENIEKMRQKTVQIHYKEHPNLKISFYTRHCTMEGMFGGGELEEENIAIAILESLLKVRANG